MGWPKAPTTTGRRPLNWNTDVAPTGNADETLIFPFGANQSTAENDIAAGSTFHDIRFEAPGYTLTGNGLELDTGVAATNGSGSNTYSIPTTFTGNDGVFSQTAGGTLVTTGTVDLNWRLAHACRGWQLHRSR